MASWARDRRVLVGASFTLKTAVGCARRCRDLGATDKPLRFIDAEKPGFFKRLFGSK
jgi:hypothetical protein